MNAQKTVAMKGCLNSLYQLAGLVIIVVFLFAIYVDEPAELTTPDPVPVVAPVTLPPPPPVPDPHIPPPSSHWTDKLARFVSHPCKAQCKEIFTACNFQDMRKRVFAEIHPSNNGPFNLGVVCDVFDYLYSQWQYRSDPITTEFFADATDSWDMRAGDCDDFAIAMAAALQCTGGYPRIILAGFNNGNGHAYCEVNLGSMDLDQMTNYLKIRYKLGRHKVLYYRFDSYGNLYLNLDWTENHPGGHYQPSQYETALYPVGKLCETL